MTCRISRKFARRRSEIQSRIHESKRVSDNLAWTFLSVALCLLMLVIQGKERHRS